MSFNEYLIKAKLPDMGSMQRYQFEALRRIARNAYTAGRKEGTQQTRTRYEKSRRAP